MTPDVAIVGNGVAGHACAMRLARGGVRALLVGPGLPTDRPPLSKQALVESAPRLLSDEARLAERGIGRLDGQVEEADLAARRLVVRTEGEVVEVTARAVVLATGLSYAPPPVPGLDAAYVNATPEGLAALRPELERGARRVLVAGAGLVGTETALTLAAAGHAVTVVDLLERPLDRLHDPLPALAARLLAEHGATFLGGVQIEAAEIANGAARLLTTGGALEAELVIAATGGRPAPAPGLDRRGPLEVDRGMRVPGLDGVYAIGDLVIPLHARYGRLRFPQWDGAVGTAENATAAILGAECDYERVPYWWSDLGALRVSEVGAAAAAVEWSRVGEALHAGRDEAGDVVCACVIGEPRRLREAYALIGSGPGA